MEQPLNITMHPAPDLTTFSLFFLIDLLQVDLTSFLVSGASLLGHEAAERVTKSRVINRTKGFLTVNQETVAQLGDMENIFSCPRPSVSRLR